MHTKRFSDLIGYEIVFGMGFFNHSVDKRIPGRALLLPNRFDSTGTGVLSEGLSPSLPRMYTPTH